MVTKYSQTKLVRIAAIVGIFGLIIIGLTLVINKSNSSKSELARLPEIISQTSGTSAEEVLLVGRPSAPVKIVEYTDFKCPQCNQFVRGAGEQIRQKYIETGKVKLEMRPYPVFGEDAGLALYGAYCANEQSVFEAYRSAMFDYMWRSHYRGGSFEAAAKPVLSSEVIATVAAGVGADKTNFSACLAGETHKSAYSAAMTQAASDAVQGTPTYIIGGQKVVGNQPFEIYQTLIDIELKKVK